MESFLGDISRNLYPEPEVMKTRAKGPPDEPTPEEAALVARGRARAGNTTQKARDKTTQAPNGTQAPISGAQNKQQILTEEQDTQTNKNPQGVPQPHPRNLKSGHSNTEQGPPPIRNPYKYADYQF